MRIIAGANRSRLLKTLASDATRPTLDKVKEAVFSKLGTYFEKGNILDLFAGSGAISLEALSRGFTSATLVDNNPKAIGIIKENVNSLKENDKCTVLKMSYQNALEYVSNQKFDLIYLDPPYHLQLGSDLLSKIEELNILALDGMIVLETQKDEDICVPKNFELDKQVVYGICKITYVRKK